MVRIKWLFAAKLDLKEIYDYIALDSKRYARLQLERIFDKTSAIKTNIYIGKVNAEMNNVSIRELVSGNYRIIYRIVANEEIHILLVHHSSRSLDKRLQ